MLRKFVLVMLALAFAVSIADAQNDDPARLRLMQLSFVGQNGVVDILIDDEAVFTAVSFPFATDYLELASGDHMLMTRMSDDSSAAASIALQLQAGHSYSVIVEGNYADEVTFVVIDETDLLGETTGSAAIVVNLTDQLITDVTLDSDPAAEEIAPDSYQFIPLPAAEYTLSGMLGDQSYSETFNPHANTLFLVAVRQSPSGDPQIIYQRSSRLTAAEYLQSISEGAQFSQIAAFISMTDLLALLSDDGEYTLFLPVNPVVESGAVTDAAVLSNYMIAQALPPYLLPQHTSLTTLAGNIVSLDFSDTASGYWEIGGAPILWDVRLANGVIYAIDGIINQ